MVATAPGEIRTEGVGVSENEGVWGAPETIGDAGGAADMRKDPPRGIVPAGGSGAGDMRNEPPGTSIRGLGGAAACFAAGAELAFALFRDSYAASTGLSTATPRGGVTARLAPRDACASSNGAFEDAEKAVGVCTSCDITTFDGCTETVGAIDEPCVSETKENLARLSSRGAAAPRAIILS